MCDRFSVQTCKAPKMKIARFFLQFYKVTLSCKRRWGIISLCVKTCHEWQKATRDFSHQHITTYLKTSTEKFKKVLTFAIFLKNYSQPCLHSFYRSFYRKISLVMIKEWENYRCSKCVAVNFHRSLYGNHLSKTSTSFFGALFQKCSKLYLTIQHYREPVQNYFVNYIFIYRHLICNF